jgi:hypothetical protein
MAEWYGSIIKSITYILRNLPCILNIFNSVKEHKSLIDDTRISSIGGIIVEFMCVALRIHQKLIAWQSSARLKYIAHASFFCLVSQWREKARTSVNNNIHIVGQLRSNEYHAVFCFNRLNGLKTNPYFNDFIACMLSLWRRSVILYVCHPAL